MRLFYVLLATLLLSSSLGYSQELVQNGSFENMTCPIDGTDCMGGSTSYLKQIALASPWKTATDGSPDLFSRGCNAMVSVPNNVYGRQDPIPGYGNVYAGLYYRSHKNQATSNLDYREYVTQQLLGKLRPGGYYRIKFAVALANNAFSNSYSRQFLNVTSGGIGLLLTHQDPTVASYACKTLCPPGPLVKTKSIKGLWDNSTQRWLYDCTNGTDITPQVILNPAGGLKATGPDNVTRNQYGGQGNYWWQVDTLIQIPYDAVDLQYVTIGAFKSNLVGGMTNNPLVAQNISNVDPNANEAYYYIDGVSIREVASLCDCYTGEIYRNWDMELIRVSEPSVCNGQNACCYELWLYNSNNCTGKIHGEIALRNQGIDCFTPADGFYTQSGDQAFFPYRDIIVPAYERVKIGIICTSTFVGSRNIHATTTTGSTPCIIKPVSVSCGSDCCSAYTVTEISDNGELDNCCRRYRIQSPNPNCGVKKIDVFRNTPTGIIPVVTYEAPNLTNGLIIDLCKNDNDDISTAYRIRILTNDDQECLRAISVSCRVACCNGLNVQAQSYIVSGQCCANIVVTNNNTCFEKLALNLVDGNGNTFSGVEINEHDFYLGKGQSYQFTFCSPLNYFGNVILRFLSPNGDHPTVCDKIVPFNCSSSCCDHIDVTEVGTQNNSAYPCCKVYSVRLDPNFNSTNCPVYTRLSILHNGMIQQQFANPNIANGMNILLCANSEDDRVFQIRLTSPSGEQCNKTQEVRCGETGVCCNQFVVGFQPARRFVGGIYAQPCVAAVQLNINDISLPNCVLAGIRIRYTCGTVTNVYEEIPLLQYIPVIGSGQNREISLGECCGDVQVTVEFLDAMGNVICKKSGVVHINPLECCSNPKEENTAATSMQADKDCVGKLKVYPSPVENNLSVQLDGGSPTLTTVKVFTLQGELVHQQQMRVGANSTANIRLDKLGLSSGTYSVVVESAQCRYSTLVVISH